MDVATEIMSEYESGRKEWGDYPPEWKVVVLRLGSTESKRLCYTPEFLAVVYKTKPDQFRDWDEEQWACFKFAERRIILTDEQLITWVEFIWNPEDPVLTEYTINDLFLQLRYRFPDPDAAFMAEYEAEVSNSSDM